LRELFALAEDSVAELESYLYTGRVLVAVRAAEVVASRERWPITAARTSRGNAGANENTSGLGTAPVAQEAVQARSQVKSRRPAGSGR
jgi:hypothetical protein